MDLIQTSYTEEMHMKGSEEIARSNKIVKQETPEKSPNLSIVVNQSMRT